MGLLLVFTGDGKGKTTAAAGSALRAAGWGRQVCLLQFLKSPDFPSGEQRMLEHCGVKVIVTGIGYTWTKTKEAQQEALINAWQTAKQVLADPKWDLVVLDELNGALTAKGIDAHQILPVTQVIDALKSRPEKQDVIITGRNAPPEIVELADLITEMKAVRHYYQNGVAAQKGLDY